MRCENRRRSVWVALCAIAVLAGCGQRPITATIVVQTEDAPVEQMTRAAEILADRFSEIRPTMLSSVTPTVSGNTITFTFRGEARGEELLRPLALMRGELRIAPADHPEELWVSDLDVTQVNLHQSEREPMLDLRVTPEAGQRLLQATSKNIGRTVVTALDGRPIFSARIRGAFGTQFQFSVPSAQEGHLILNVLRHGRLPVAVKSFEYRAASGTAH